MINFGRTLYFITEPVSILFIYNCDIFLFPKMRKVKELMKWKQFNSAIEMELKSYF
jgi:hypothetical protein